MRRGVRWTDVCRIVASGSLLLIAAAFDAEQGPTANIASADWARFAAGWEGVWQPLDPAAAVASAWPPIVPSRVASAASPEAAPQAPAPAAEPASGAGSAAYSPPAAAAAAPQVPAPPGGPVPLSAPEPPPPAHYPNLSLAQQLIDLINQERVAVGVSPLTVNVALTASAQKYAALHWENADPYHLSHSLDGGPGDRAWREGYSGAVGEVLIGSPVSAENIMTTWLASPAHRDILLGTTYRDIGLGCEEGIYRWPEGSVWPMVICSAELGMS